MSPKSSSDRCLPTREWFPQPHRAVRFKLPGAQNNPGAGPYAARLREHLLVLMGREPEAVPLNLVFSKDFASILSCSFTIPVCHCHSHVICYVTNTGQFSCVCFRFCFHFGGKLLVLL